MSKQQKQNIAVRDDMLILTPLSHYQISLTDHSAISNQILHQLTSNNQSYTHPVQAKSWKQDKGPNRNETRNVDQQQNCQQQSIFVRDWWKILWKNHLLDLLGKRQERKKLRLTWLVIGS